MLDYASSMHCSLCLISDCGMKRPLNIYLPSEICGFLYPNAIFYFYLLYKVCVLPNSLSFDVNFQIQVRHMASRTTDAIGNEADGRYSKMWVITSDLPGMGKTRHVQKFAETNHVSLLPPLSNSLRVHSCCTNLNLISSI